MTDRPHVPRWLLPGLVVLAIFGAVSVGLTVQSQQAQDVATATQVDRIESLAEQLTTIGDRNQADDRLGHRCILTALFDIAADRPIDLPADCTPIIQGETR